MKEYIFSLADTMFKRINENLGTFSNRRVTRYSEGGDAQFGIDDIAENAVKEFIEQHDQDIALFTEDGGLHIYGENPEYMLIIDPIDGTRPAAANLEMSCISIALSPFKKDARIKDVEFALLKELKTGSVIYSDSKTDGVRFDGYANHCSLKQLKRNETLRNMFWSIEFNGHPAELMTHVYGELIDYTANNGGVFIFNSASYSISRIITGQLDAYADIGNRLLKDNPELLPQFQRVGNGKVLHLFPYDIAASVFLAQKAGVIITDAYGNSLENTILTDISMNNQQSCIAAATPGLHKAIIDNIHWDKARDFV